MDTAKQHIGALAASTANQASLSKSVSLARKLVCGATSQNQENIDGILTGYAANWDLKRMAVIDRNILRISTFEILHDAKAAITDAYDISGYPETFIIGRDGVIRKKLMTATDWNSPAARALVDRLLTERSE